MAGLRLPTRERRVPVKLSLRFESYRSGLAASTACSALSQAAGFVTLLCFARYFGAQAQTDIYLYATATLSAVAMLITSLNGSVVVPEFMRLDAQEGRGHAMAFANGCLLVYATVASALGLAIFLLPEAFLGHASRFSPETAAAGRTVILLVAPLLPAEALGTALADLLSAQRFFTVPALCIFATRLIQLACLLLFHETLGVRGMALGTLLASTLQIAALALLLRRRLGWRFRPDFSFIHPRVFRHAGVAFTGNVLSSLVYWVPQFFLTGLGGGVVSAASYAARIINLPQMLLVNHVSSVTGIKLNNLQARGRHDEVARTFSRATRALVFLLAPAAAFLSLESTGIVRLLFERGSFDARATADAALFLRYLALCLPMLAIATIVSRTFMAAQHVVPAFWFQTTLSLVNLGMLYAGLRIAGARGYLVATLAFHFCSMATILPMMRAYFPHIAFRGTLAFLAGLGLLCALLAGAARGLDLLLPPLPLPLHLALTALVFGLPLLALNARFRLNEDLADLVDRLVRALHDPRRKSGRG